MQKKSARFHFWDKSCVSLNFKICIKTKDRQNSQTVQLKLGTIGNMSWNKQVSSDQNFCIKLNLNKRDSSRLVLCDQ